MRNIIGFVQGSYPAFRLLHVFCTNNLYDVEGVADMSISNNAMQTANASAHLRVSRNSAFQNHWKKIKKSKFLYLMFLPVLAYFIIFKFWPMAGLVIAFKKFNPIDGMWGSPWVGMRYFTQFFGSVYFWRLLRNTIVINMYGLVFVFTAPIILALLLNEVENRFFKRVVQTISYLPHFISTVIIVSMAVQFMSPSNGIINNVIAALGGERIYFLSKPQLFWGIYTSIDIWRSIGWGSIIYMAAITNIDQQMYEAAIIDGAGRWKQLWHITLPCLLPTVMVLLILRIGHFMQVGFEPILLMYNTNTYETADVIETYVYRQGLQSANYSYATAVGMFQSIIGFVLVVLTNKVSKKFADQGLW